jgi:Bacterial regulatory helix-turn-helix protein, lysR family
VGSDPTGLATVAGPDLRQMRYIVKVAELGGFTAAAAELHVAQQAVSQQVRATERMLGVTLFRCPRRRRPRTRHRAAIAPLRRSPRPRFPDHWPSMNRCRRREQQGRRDESDERWPDLSSSQSGERQRTCRRSGCDRLEEAAAFCATRAWPRVRTAATSPGPLRTSSSGASGRPSRLDVVGPRADLAAAELDEARCPDHGLEQVDPVLRHGVVPGERLDHAASDA